MAPTTAPPRPLAAVPRRKFGEVALAVLVAVPLLAVALVMSRAPTHVSQITVRNPAQYEVNVQLGEDGGAHSIPLGSVDRGSFLTVEEALDVGSTWVFRFTYGGVQAAELRLSRADLAAADWTVTVPDEADATLGAQGLQPTPLPPADSPKRL